MRTQIFNLLEEEAPAISAAARSALQRDHPDLVASAGDALDRTVARALDAFVDVYVTGQMDEWDKCVADLLTLESSRVGVLMDVPFGISSVACDRLLQVAAPDAASPEEAMRSLAELQQTGDRMACRLVELYEARAGASR
jgi:hypothetical protein